VTWRLSWSLFIPDSLRATTTFTHIMQLKMPGNGSSPILTMSLRRVGGVPKIEIQVNQSGTIVGRADLAPLQNHWVDTAVEFKIGDKPDGYVHWTLTDAGRTAVDATSTGVDLWMQDRVRPKWGIYRSLGDTSGALRDCYLLLGNMRAHRKQ
jgi:chitin-binding protein